MFSARAGVAVKAVKARVAKKESKRAGRDIRRVGIQLRNRAGWLASRSCLPAVACLDPRLLFRVNVIDRCCASERGNLICEPGHYLLPFLRSSAIVSRHDFGKTPGPAHRRPG